MLSSGRGRCPSSSLIQRKEWGEGHLFFLLLLPSKGAKRAAAVHWWARDHPWEVRAWDPWTLGDEKVPCPPLWGTSTEPVAVPSSHPHKPGEIRSAGGGRIRFRKKKTSSHGALSFLLIIYPKGYFYCCQEKFTQCSCGSCGANQWYR